MTTWVTRVNERRRAVLTRQRVGRAVMIAAVVAAVTCLIGAVVSWTFLGNLRHRSAASLELVERTLQNVDETLAVAQDVTAIVGGSIETLRSSLDSVEASVDDGGVTLDTVAALTQDLPSTLDGVDEALGRLGEAASVVDGAVAAIDSLPIGPDLDDAGLGDAVEDVRADLRPIADDLRSAAGSLSTLSGRSEELVGQLDDLQSDLGELDRSLNASARLLDQYRIDTAEAQALARESLADLDRDVLILRLLGLVLALSIAIGQVAPFHIGRELARSNSPEPTLTEPVPDLR
jgi:hypothetical protein